MQLTDASRHDWLEGRGPRLTLLGLQDDATSRVTAAHFQLEPENAVGYLQLLRQLITAHGVPLSLYRDRHSIFQRNDPHWSVAEELAGQQLPTQVGRALEEYGYVSFEDPIPESDIEGLIELKNAADEDADIWAAYRQLQTYKAEIPSLLHYNAALVVSDGL